MKSESEYEVSCEFKALLEGDEGCWGKSLGVISKHFMEICEKNSEGGGHQDQGI